MQATTRMHKQHLSSHLYTTCIEIDSSTVAGPVSSHTSILPHRHTHTCLVAERERETCIVRERERERGREAPV
jgi:hypothetical protein